MEEAVKLASCFSSKLNDVTLKTNSTKSILEVFSNHTEFGSHQAKIDSEIKGKDINITFNWRYMLDGLKNINNDELVLEFNGDQKPAVMRPVKSNDYFYILMPIKNT